MQLTELQERWLSALESGEYAQGCGTMKQGDNYCCLGVACAVMGLQTVEKVGLVEYFWDIQNKVMASADIPGDDWITLGLHSSRGDLLNLAVLGDFIGSNPGDYKTLDSLSDANDQGANFAQIAAYCRKHPENVFTN